jgi:hypothetical protein
MLLQFSSVSVPYLDSQCQVAHGYMSHCVLPTAHYMSTKHDDVLIQVFLLITSEGRSCNNQWDVFQSTQIV